MPRRQRSPLLSRPKPPRPERRPPKGARHGLKTVIRGRRLKSHSGAKKRFFRTASGKLAYRKCGRSHIMVHKGAKRLRTLRKTGYVTETLMEQMNHLLPY